MNSRQFERNYWARSLGVTDYGRRRPRVGDIQPRDGFPIREPEFRPCRLCLTHVYSGDMG